MGVQSARNADSCQQVSAALSLAATEFCGPAETDPSDINQTRRDTERILHGSEPSRQRVESTDQREQASLDDRAILMQHICGDSLLTGNRIIPANTKLIVIGSISRLTKIVRGLLIYVRSGNVVGQQGL